MEVVVGPELQRRLRRRSPDRQADEGARALGQHRATNAHAVARRQVRPLLQRADRPLVDLPHRRWGAHEPHREAPGPVPAGLHARPTFPGRTARADGRRTSQSVLLYDEFDIWEVRPDGSGARMITNGEGRKQSLIFRYRSLDPEERTIPTTKPMLLATTNERTRATGFYRTAFSTTAAPEKLVMQDKAFGGLAKAEEGRHARVHDGPVRGVRGPLACRRPHVQGHAEGVERQPAAGAVRVGQVRVDRVHQQPTARSSARSSPSPRTSTRRRSTR